MEYRRLGHSGLKISTITMGTMTIGGGGKFAQVGDVGVADARRYVDLCLDAGVNLIDTADIYSAGACEEIIGEVLGGKRKAVCSSPPRHASPWARVRMTAVFRAIT
jgi:aryl-alcohol dehydrogenase-like predicted oxidoreductase